MINLQQVSFKASTTNIAKEYESSLNNVIEKSLNYAESSAKHGGNSETFKNYSEAGKNFSAILVNLKKYDLLNDPDQKLNVYV